MVTYADVYPGANHMIGVYVIVAWCKKRQRKLLLRPQAVCNLNEYIITV